MTEQHIVTQGRTPLIVEKSEWKGETRLDIRLWYTTPEGQLARTQKGVSLNLESAEALFAVMDALLHGEA